MKKWVFLMFLAVMAKQKQKKIHQIVISDNKVSTNLIDITPKDFTTTTLEQSRLEYEPYLLQEQEQIEEELTVITDTDDNKKTPQFNMPQIERNNILVKFIKDFPFTCNLFYGLIFFTFCIIVFWYLILTPRMKFKTIKKRKTKKFENYASISKIEEEPILSQSIIKEQQYYHNENHKLHNRTSSSISSLRVNASKSKSIKYGSERSLDQQFIGEQSEYKDTILQDSYLRPSGDQSIIDILKEISYMEDIDLYFDQ